MPHAGPAASPRQGDGARPCGDHLLAGGRAFWLPPVLFLLWICTRATRKRTLSAVGPPVRTHTGVNAGDSLLPSPRDCVTAPLTLFRLLARRVNILHELLARSLNILHSRDLGAPGEEGKYTASSFRLLARRVNIRFSFPSRKGEMLAKFQIWVSGFPPGTLKIP